LLRLIRTPKIIHHPQKWTDIPRGSCYQQTLQAQLNPWLTKIFGYHLLKLGQLSIDIDTQKCAVHHHINMANSGDNLHVQADYHHLPLANKSIDACLLAHLLPYDNNPYRLLREIDRVLVDDGWLVISGFNLLSLMGLSKLVPVLRSRQPYSSYMYAELRLLDWLTLLNYEILHHGCFQVLPWNSISEKFLTAHIPAVGCLNMIIARKRTVPLTLTPLKQYQLKLNWGKKVMGTARTCERHSGDSE
jgi:SAM-dependent methyltransferase